MGLVLRHCFKVKSKWWWLIVLKIVCNYFKRFHVNLKINTRKKWLFLPQKKIHKCPTKWQNYTLLQNTIFCKMQSHSNKVEDTCQSTNSYTFFKRYKIILLCVYVPINT